MRQRKPILVAGVIAAAVVIGLLVWIAARAGDRRDDASPPVSVGPATQPQAAATPPAVPVTVASAQSRAPAPATVAAATQPSLADRLDAARREADAAMADLRAARNGTIERLAQQQDYRQARQAWVESEARVKALRPTNDQPAIAQASQEWMARKSAYHKIMSAALDADPAVRTAARRVADAANTGAYLERQVAERDAAERERQETLAHNAQVVEAAVAELNQRARSNLQFLLDRGVVESIDEETGDVLVDPLVWEPLRPETRDAIALTLRQSHQAAGRKARRFRIISSRNDTVFATYEAPPPSTTATRPATGA